MKTMSKKNWKREQELNSALALSHDGINVHDALGVLDTFRRYERKLQRLAELSCNGYPKLTIEYRDGKMYHYNVEDVELRERSEKQEANTERAITELARAYRLTVDFQGDPRGLMFSLKTSEGRDINFTF
jgi:hypothetical protein